MTPDLGQLVGGLRGLTAEGEDATRFEMQRILCAVDFSDAANEALRQADALVRATKGKLAVCHVVADGMGVHPLFPQREVVDALASSERELQAQQVLGEHVAKITGREPTEFEVFVEVGVPYAEVVRRAESWAADLVVAGSRGHTGLMRILLGGVAAQIVRYCHGPVLIARPGSPASGIVIAATDLSDASLPAIDMAVREARMRKAELVVVHALDLAPPSVLLGLGSPFGLAYTGPSTEVIADVRAAARETLQSALVRFNAQAEIVILDGHAATAIALFAEERAASLIVVGTRGRTGLARVAIGSVAEKIVHTAPCSVLAVRLHTS